MRKAAGLFAIFALISSLSIGFGAPVSEQDRVPVDLRRTTLVVRDIENSLALYRDVFGMKVIYDNAIRTPRGAQSDAEAERSSRLVFLRANDSFVGVLGLLQYIKPEKQRPIVHDAFQPGTVVLLFNATDVDQKYAFAQAVSGVKPLSEPRLTQYPGYEGGDPIDVKVSVLFDPDGFVIELNELLSTLQ